MYKKTVSIFMILLIVTLPVYISTAMAQPLTFYERPGQKISRIQFYGQDEINGVIRSNDNITVWVQIEAAGVSPSNVIFAGVQPFDSCSQSLGKSTCTYSEQVSSQVGKNSFTVKYKTEDQATQTYYVDNTAPEIKTIAAEPDGEGNLTFSYDIQDYYSGKDSESCAGLQKIEIYESGTLKKTEQIDTTNCREISQLSIKPTGATGAASNVSFCAKAYDNFNQATEKCLQVFIDNSLPVIGKAEPYSGTTKIENFKTGLNTFQIRINVTDESGLKQVLINSTALSLVNKQMSCSAGICTVEVTGNVNEDTTSFDLTISAEDNNGNKATTEQAIPVAPDDTAPVITSVTIIPGGDFLSRENNTIIATINEVGAGLYSGDIQADLTPIGRPVSGATSCSSIGTVWTCTWQDVKATVPGTWKITFKLKDLVGNVGQTYEKIFTVDLVDPEVESVNVTTEEGFDFFQVRDSLIVTTTLFDFTSGIDESRTFIDTSSFSTASKVTPTCSELGAGKHECEFIIPQITGPQTANFFITVYDKAGNSATSASTSLNILGVIEKPSELWTASVGKQKPAKIDKQTTTLIQHNAYFPVTLVPKGAGAEVLFAEISNCGPQAATQYLAGSNPVVISRNEEQVIIKFPLAQTTVDVDELIYECNLRVISKIGTRATQPETVPFNVTLAFYNMPLGELSDNVVDEITRVSKSGLVQAEWVSTINDALTRIEQACKLIGVLGSVLEIISLFGLSTSWMENIPLLQSFTIPMETSQITMEASASIVIKVARGVCIAADCKIIEKIIESSGLTLDRFLESNEAIRSVAANTNIKFSSIGNYFDSKKSLFGAIVNLCLPGIFYNLQKARNIECQYVQCLRDEVPTGTPVAICANMRSFQWCTYVTGAWWELNPLNRIRSWLFNNIRAWLNDPVSSGFTILGVVVLFKCWGIPKKELRDSCRLGYWTDVGARVISVISYFANIRQNWYMEEDLCETYGIVGEEEETAPSQETQQEAEI